MSEASHKNIIIVGNPNSGKSFLFNRLTGLQQKVANFPGITVEIRSGRYNEELLIKDFPGMYSLNPLSRDEQVAVNGLQEAMENQDTAGIVYVADATRLNRSLFLLLQIIEQARAKQIPFLVALNVMDEIQNNNAVVNIPEIAKQLGCIVHGVSARTGQGLDLLKKDIEHLANHEERHKFLPAKTSRTPQTSLRELADNLAKQYGPKVELLIRQQEKLDSFFLSSFWGALAFFAIMTFLFQSIFTWAAPMMDLVGEFISLSGQYVSGLVPSGIFQDFIKGALFEGFGSFLVFAPQIFVLFFIIGFLEDSGYLARAAIICHKPLSYFGLSGKSFIAILSGHACAIPAILSARSIESPRRRLITQLITPLLSCSARLPVYALFIGSFVPASMYLGGLIGLQGLAFSALYLLGIVSALIVASFAQFSLKKNHSDYPFVVELPPYRIPNFKSIVSNASTRMFQFIRKAGGIIFTVTILIWILGYFPSGNGHLEESWLAKIGHAIEPIFRPLGMDWKITVAVMTSFLAREVFVGTLGTLYGLEDATENISDLGTKIVSGGMTLATAMSLLVFFVLAMQCVSTLAVLKSETGSKKIPIFVFLGYSLLAYLSAFITYQVFV